MTKINALLGAIMILIGASCTKAIIDEESPTDPSIDEATYNGHIQEIIFNNCVTCHSGSAPSASLDLTTYENVRFSAENGAFLSRIEDVGNPMPPAGLLTTEHRARIAKWAEDGFPEN